MHPIPLRKDLFPASTPIKCPPSQFFRERHGPRRRAAARCLLKRVPVVAVTLLKESLVEIVIESASRSTSCHGLPFQYYVSALLCIVPCPAEMVQWIAEPML